MLNFMTYSNLVKVILTMKKLLSTFTIIFLLLFIVWHFKVTLLATLLKRNIVQSRSGQELVVKDDDFNMSTFLLSKKEEPSFDNTQDRISSLEKALKEETPGMHYTYISFQLISETLRIGDYEKCLKHLEQVSNLPTKNYFFVTLFNDVLGKLFYNSYILNHPERTARIKGLIYLRWAEDENCKDYKLDEQSNICIFPSNTFSKTSKLNLAIENFRISLGRYPNDIETKWLLNICYALLGDYPEGVPEGQLIDLHKFESNDTLVKYTNIALSRKVNFNSFYGGVCIDDFNNDGHLDILTSSGNLNKNVQYYQEVGQEFKEVGQSNHINQVGGVHITQGDYNNDGYLDVYIIRGGWLMEDYKKHPNSLLKKNGDGSFTDVTEEAGLLSFTASHTATWSDFNADGWLDLFVGNELTFSQLFLNNAGNGFTEVSKSAGIEVNKMVKGCFSSDINNDLLPDLYVSCFNDKNYLFLNQSTNGHISFRDISLTAGVEAPLKSFSCSIFDFNNDGWMDIFCPSYTMDMHVFCSQFSESPIGIEPAKLYLNQGNNTFSPLKNPMLERNFLAMGLNFEDVDNDGFLDIYMGTGYPDLASIVPNILLYNDHGKGFIDISSTSNTGHLQKGHGISFFDYERDGDLDIYESMGGFYPIDQFDNVLFQNKGTTNN
jgi:tetratricopeptide (TPR) repeat protein